MKCTQTTTCQKPWCAEEPRHSTSEAASPDGPAGRVGPPLVSGNVTAKQSPTLTTTFPLWKLRPREGRTAHGHMESEHPGLLQPPRPPHASPSWPGARSQLDGAPLGRRDGGVTYEGDQQDQQQGLLVPWGQFSSLTQEIVQESSEEELNSGHTPALHTGWAGSGRAGSAAMAHGPSRSAACGIFPDRGMNPCPLHRQADSQPLRHQGSLKKEVLIRNGCSCVSGWMGKLRLSCDLPEHQLHGECPPVGGCNEKRMLAMLPHCGQTFAERMKKVEVWKWCNLSEFIVTGQGWVCSQDQWTPEKLNPAGFYLVRREQCLTTESPTSRSSRGTTRASPTAPRWRPTWWAATGPTPWRRASSLGSTGGSSKTAPWTGNTGRTPQTKFSSRSSQCPSC
ncbi:receptor activity-modifying protein 3 isoform X2 [Tursiops truncatus]|uniref:receptor activity-modifying protein 3 isoform X2 n=1 Tax=Tursiops truncatus TaxID=9739 RepID=UPI003CCFAC86